MGVYGEIWRKHIISLKFTQNINQKISHGCCPADSLMSINEFSFSHATGLFILYSEESKI